MRGLPIARRQVRFLPATGVRRRERRRVLRAERVRFVLEQRGFGAETSCAARTAGRRRQSAACAARWPRRCQGCARRRTSRRWRCCSSASRTSRGSCRPGACARSLARSPSRPNRRCSRRSTPASPRSKRRSARGDYRRAFAEVAGLRPAVDRFFTEVFVMADDARLRTARLTLMADLRDLDSFSSRTFRKSFLRRSRRHRWRRSSHARRPPRSQPPSRQRQPARRARRPRRSRRPQGSSRRRPRRRLRRRGKYVYLFGRKTDGNGSMKPLLGGKGANLAEMCRIGLPVPPGFTITTEVCTYYYANKRTYPPALRRPDGSGRRARRAADRQEVRRPEEPAAGLGPLGRARLDAGHDGHDPQPRPERPDRRGAGDEDRQSALCVGLLPPLRADVRRRRARRAEAAGRGSRPVRDGDSRPEARALSPGHRRHQADRRRPEGAGRRASRRWSRSAPASSSPSRRGISCWAPSARCSGRG